MNDLPDVVLIILNWNARPYLEECLASLFELDYDNFSVLLIDNASTDDSVAYVREAFPQVEVICNDRNLGYAGGNNVGLRRTEAEITILLNPDVIVARDWLQNLVAAMRSDKGVGVCGSKMHYPGGRRIQHAGGYITRPQAFPGHYGLNEEDEGQYNVPRDVDYVIGAALAVRRSVIEDIGLLDEGFFLFYDDADFCTRAWRAGYRVVYAPEAALIHVESPLTDKGSDAYLSNMHTSRWRYLLKHYDIEYVLRETVPAEAAWLTGRTYRERRALARSYRHTLKNLPDIWAARARHGGSIVSDITDEQEQQIVARLQALRDAAWHPTQREPGSGDEDIAEVETPQVAVISASEQMEARWRVQEHPFASHVPIFGGLIARFREAWNSVSTKWYVRTLLNQQNEYNWLVKQRFEEMQNLVDELDARLIDSDREEVQLARQVGELTHAISRLEKRIAEMQEQLEEFRATARPKS